MKTGLLIFLFAVGTLAFKRVWEGKHDRQERLLYLALAVICWASMGIVGYATP